MASAPGVYKRELEDRRYILTEQGLVRGRAVVLDRETRSPLPPDYWIEPGMVIVRRKASGRFVHASHPDGERNQPERGRQRRGARSAQPEPGLRRPLPR